MSSPIAIPRSNKATASAASLSSSYSSEASSSSPATSYSPTHTKGLYVPIHKRSTSPSPSPIVESQMPSPKARTYSIHDLLSLRPEAHAHGYTDSVKAKLRAGPAPELVMNRKMRKNLEFAEHHHKRVSPTSSLDVSPVSKTTPLPPAIVAPVPTPTPAMTKTESPRTKFSSRTPHPHPHQQSHPHPQTSDHKKQPFGGLHSNLANWRTPVPPRLAVN